MELGQGALLEIFKQNNLAEVSFLLACNLLKMDAYSRKFVLVRTPVISTTCDQIRQQLIKILQTIFIFNKSKRFQRSDIKINGQRYQLVRCHDISKRSVPFRYMSRRLYDVSSWLVPIGTSWYVFATSQVRHSYLGNSWDVGVTSQIGRFYLGTSKMSWQRLSPPISIHLALS